MRLNPTKRTNPKKPAFILVAAGLLALAAMFLFWPTPSASAQCGSQASSCKNCHEVQGAMPVNNDGTGWHESHAFGDFCEFCHAGNVQSPDKAEAHTGMVPPLSDVDASCASCHPNDLMEKAEVYATALGVEVGTGGDPPSGAGTMSESYAASEPETPRSDPPAPAGEDAMVIDYAQRYDETVLGVRSINWGNLILGLMIATVAAGGGWLVWWNERRLRPDEHDQIAEPGPESASQARTETPNVEGYPAEVTDLLPLIAQLNPIGLHALRRLLQDPDQASELLHSLSRLDPELVRRIRNLDRESRALLMALAD